MLGKWLPALRISISSCQAALRVCMIEVNRNGESRFAILRLLSQEGHRFWVYIRANLRGELGSTEVKSKWEEKYLTRHHGPAKLLTSGPALAPRRSLKLQPTEARSLEHSPWAQLTNDIPWKGFNQYLFQTPIRLIKDGIIQSYWGFTSNEKKYETGRHTESQF